MLSTCNMSIDGKSESRSTDFRFPTENSDSGRRCPKAFNFPRHRHSFVDFHFFPRRVYTIFIHVCFFKKSRSIRFQSSGNPDSARAKNPRSAPCGNVSARFHTVRAFFHHISPVSGDFCSHIDFKTWIFQFHDI